MSLPKEPRQKMINMMYLVLTALLALNVSVEILNAFKVVDKSLQNSNTNISTANATLYKSLSDKLKKPETAEKAAIWQPKADKARVLSDALNTFIEDLKLKLKNEAGLKKDKDGNEDFNESDLEAATRLFGTMGNGKILEQKLLDYRTAMLEIDPAIKTEFEKTLPIDVSPPVGQDGKKKDFTSAFFHMTPTVAALTILSKFQNNVKNSENQVVTYCHNKIGAVEVVYDQFAALVGQSSNYVMPGQEIEITAGVGAYSKAAKPDITIAGSRRELDAEGRAVYKFNASGSGDQSVSVNVSYTKPDGTKESKPFTVKYTVGTPGGTAVMLDKMNVFYIGVDNPVSINSGAGDEKTSVSMSGGTIRKTSAGHYIVTVTTPGKATINVSADGKNNPFDFKVKNIPPPILMVGPSEGGAIQSVVFKNQPACRAELKGFDFDYRYSVVSATVYFSGANFPSVQQASITGGSLAGLAGQLAKCIPGTSVNFDNVKVQGPGGPVISIPGPGFILR